MRQKKLVPSIDQKCVCGHSYAAHYKPNHACAQDGCCDTFRPESEATIRLADRPAQS